VRLRTTADSGSRNRVLPLVSDPGNRRLLTGWIGDHPSYEAVEFAGVDGSDFDVCVLDREAFREHHDDLRKKKERAAPVLLPYLLLLPESGSEIIEADGGQLADNVVTEEIDELVTLPIQQAELHWRIEALLRLRNQSLALRERERELERQVDLFEKAQDIADVGAWEYGIEDGTHLWTEEVHRIYGLPQDETPSAERSIQYYHPEDRPAIEEAFGAATEDGEPYDIEARLIDADGNQRWVRTMGEPRYEDGELTHVRGTIQDITERKDREETLKRRTHVIDEAPVGISISDPKRGDDPLIYVNDAFVEMTGYPREEVLGKNRRFLHGDGTDPETVARVREAVDKQEPVSVDIRNYRRDGTEFWNHLEVAPVRDGSGDVVNRVGFRQDITGRKNRQRQLEVLDRILRHNIRNDMNVIQGRAETIRSMASGEAEASAGRIVDTSDRLLELAQKEREITEVLRKDPTHEKVDVGDVLRRVSSDVGSEHPKATVAVECPDDVSVHATTQFPQAVRELVTNAVVHNDSASPDVAVAVERNEDVVRIEVADNGPRIPEVERGLLVDEEEQTPLYHGTGLGLWLVRLIVSRTGGTVTVEENTPAGNIVGIEIPR
jgi:PAS domain S-box-containing protein